MSIVIFLSLISLGHFSVTRATFWAELKVSEPPTSKQLVGTDSLSDFVKSYMNESTGNLASLSSSFLPDRDVIFELYTLKNPKEPQILQLNDVITVKNSHYDRNLPTRILIHGWLNRDVLAPRFTEAYFDKGNKDINFIAINWQKVSDVINYVGARRRVNEVGECVARFINFLEKHSFVNKSSLILIGHSLGAHIAGLAGKKVTGNKVGKIVGLDPAAPLFKYEEVENRLADTDALYVEVIYTSKLGHVEPLGQANFYPNGGRFQPGCTMDVFGRCAHIRAWKYYIESIVDPQFYAFECDSIENLRMGNCFVVNEVVQMAGEPGNSDLKGVFYLRTNEHSKYGKGTDGISEELKKAKKKARQAHNEQVLSKIIRSSIDDKRKTLIRKLTYSKKKSIKS